MGTHFKINKDGSNMYPWIQATHTHLGGECSHKCTYCYVDSPRFGRAPIYSGPIRLLEDEFKVSYNPMKRIGKPSMVVFIEHMNDLWAEDVPTEFIERILAHCGEYPENTYVFQTKNPKRFLEESLAGKFPPKYIIGCTIETNRSDEITKISKAPHPLERAVIMTSLNIRKFITLEPLLKMDPEVLVDWITRINPEWVNIGIDSKGHKMSEPTAEEIRALIAGLNAAKIRIDEKHNLTRLLPEIQAIKSQVVIS
jgi:DNA repair photolyase